MTIPTAVCAMVALCIAAVAGPPDNAAPVIACNLKAIHAAERPRYNRLTKQLKCSVRERSSRDAGYAYLLDSRRITLPEVAEWISMERLCCPFLTFQLTADGGKEEWLLTLTGPGGVKALLEAEFATR